MYYVIIVALVAIDQAIKYLVRVNMHLGETVPVVENVIHITYVSNSGGAFSILQGQTALLLAVPTVMSAAILWYIHKNRNSTKFMPLLALSAIASGGMGNLIDRARFGHVVDFIDFRVFPVFNFADICVCCGCGLLVLHMLFFEKKAGSLP